MINLPNHKHLILFDGVCNLCNSSIQFVIKHDKENIFMFAALQSEIAKQLIQEYNFNTKKVDSILLFTKEKGIQSKSTAALHIAKHLNFPVNLLCVFFVIPEFIRNWVYSYIAKNRYKWFGKKQVCMTPTPNLKAKFLN